MAPQKRCSKCGETKPTASFHTSNKAKDGLQSACASCLIASSKPWREANKAKINARSKAWSEANKERSEARRKRWRSFSENSAKDTAYAAKRRAALGPLVWEQTVAWRAANPGRAEATQAKHRTTARYAETTQKWREANRLRLANKEHRRNVLKRNGTISEFTVDELKLRLSVFGGNCAYCNDAEWAHMDHVKPLSLGGPHCLSNLRPACAHCNLSKSAKAPKQWLSSMRTISPLPLP